MEKLASTIKLTMTLFCVAVLTLSVESQEYSFLFNENAIREGKYAITNYEYSFNKRGLPVIRILLPNGKAGDRPVVNLNIKESRSLPGVLFENISLDYTTQVYSETANRKKQWFCDIIPVKGSSTITETLVSFSLEISYVNDNEIISALRFPPNTMESVLADGEVYKIKIEKTGLHKIDINFLQNTLGINTANLDPRNIKIYGNGGGRLPVANSEFRHDDLVENAIFIAGESDGKFDNADLIIFYAEGPDKWEFKDATGLFFYNKNIYDNYNYYFLKISGSRGKRIANGNVITNNPDLVLDTYESIQHYEEDKTNLLGANANTNGSGKDWFGDYYKGTRTYDYTSRFDFTNLVTGSEAEVRGAFAGRSDKSSTVRFQFGQQQYTASIGSVHVGDSESLYAKIGIVSQKMIFTQANPTISVTYPSNAGDSEGWLDYIQIICPKKLVLSNAPLTFRSRQLKNVAIGGFTIENYQNQNIWDITNPLHPVLMSVQGGRLVFETNNTCREFVAFTNNNVTFVPVEGVRIENQNLHGLEQTDMVIVYHPDFKQSAQTLAEHRATFSGLNVTTASVHQIYNEFSSGRVDPAAIRDFARMLYQRYPDFKYLLLFGDGSYDYKGLMPNLTYGNFVPVFETDQSLDPIFSFPTDDFFGLLDDGEGQDLRGGVDVSVGRLPAKSIAEADVLVNKIIHYDTNPATLGDWRLRTGYAADDEDFNTHIEDTDEIALRTDSKFPLYNQQKVYFDAFPQVATAGDPRFPEANNALNANVFAGQLTLTYLGHGGPQGWAQERVLTLKDIKGWTNYNELFLMITATCSFAAYDDPKIVSPGEEALLNAKGGAIALFSTTRAVFTTSNKALTDAVHQNAFRKEGGKALTFGNILTTSKNNSSASFENSRKFTLLGDPSQTLALPKENIILTKVNKKALGEDNDTLKAMTFIEMEGFVADGNNQQITNFNGTMQTVIFDKIKTLRTLVNDPRSNLYEFKQYQNIIFKGKTSVRDGAFKFGFWVPKDINYEIGYGRISMYASDGQSRDAAGYSNQIKVGGSSPNGLADDVPPRVELFMNDESFVSGGITNKDPILLVKLEDDFGINVTGNAIGHDITSVLNNNTAEASVLNDFFEGDTDSYKSGMVRYPLKDLAPGKHTIRVKAWDIANNSAEKSTDFMVVSSQQDFLDRVLNYPNPFTTNTRFEFDHDLNNTNLDIHVYIYSVSGKLVKTVEHSSFYQGNRVNDVRWNGRDDYEDRLARGVYLYKIKVHARELNQTRESKFEKLVIL